MTIKLDTLLNWVPVKEGQFASFDAGENEGNRIIRLSVNCPQPVNIWLEAIEVVQQLGSDGVPEYLEAVVPDSEIFVAHVPAGRENVEFWFAGSFRICGVGGDFFLNSADGTRLDTRPFDETSFTRIWEREERDPAIVEMEYKARMRMEQRMAELSANFEKQLSAQAALFNETIAARTSVPPVSSGGEGSTDGDTGGEGEGDDGDGTQGE